MKDAGIRGARNGRDTYNPNIYRYYSPKIEATQREIFPDIKIKCISAGFADKEEVKRAEELASLYNCDFHIVASKFNRIIFILDYLAAGKKKLQIKSIVLKSIQ